MGEIADDCYDRALDELENLECDPDYYGGRGFDYAQPFYPRPAPFRRRTSLDDFDALE